MYSVACFGRGFASQFGKELPEGHVEHGEVAFNFTKPNGDFSCAIVCEACAKAFIADMFAAGWDAKVERLTHFPIDFRNGNRAPIYEEADYTQEELDAYYALRKTGPQEHYKPDAAELARLELGELRAIEAEVRRVENDPNEYRENLSFDHELEALDKIRKGINPYDIP